LRKPVGPIGPRRDKLAASSSVASAINMRILVTGSAGHLGEALMRTLEHSPHEALGLDAKRSSYTSTVGSITDRGCVRHCMRGVDAVLHTATLHKPHIATHARQDFIDTNVTGSLNLLEEAAAVGVRSFVYTSSTSVFGRALSPPSGAPASWITEEVTPEPKNIYGITKFAAEQLCQLFHYRNALPCVVLRTSRFFPEEDDDKAVRRAYANDNVKLNELMYRRTDLEDVVSAHLLAMEKASAIGIGPYIISATTPFSRDELAALRVDARSVVRAHFPEYEPEYARRGWSMVRAIDRVYVNERARSQLGWQPRYDFAYAIRCLQADEDYRSSLARAVGCKGYHAQSFAEGPYPTE
jgi:UDP-glucose 4-epimerase